MVEISAFIIARNEYDTLGDTIDSLMNQTHKLDFIVVVDDGSWDLTAVLAKVKGCEVVRLPYHEDSYVGRPELANVCNAGLKSIKEHSTSNYILQMGADHILSTDYVKSIIIRMVNNNVAIASGGTQLEKLNPDTPWGSGRIIDANIWREINGIQYPVKWGYESWIVYRMRQLGYQVKRYDDVHSFTRPVRMYPEKAYYWGKCSYALGSSFPFVLIKSLRMKVDGINYIKGYFSRQDVIKHEDISDYVRNQQYERGLDKVIGFLRMNEMDKHEE